MSSKTSAFSWVAGLLLVLSYGGVKLFIKNRSPAVLKVLLSEPPSSFDPFDFDLKKHHIFQGMTGITLFSNYGDSVLRPVLVKSWSSSNSETQWRFKIRNDLFFWDGRQISLKDVQDSLRRVVDHLVQTNSTHDLVSALRKNKNSKITKVEIEHSFRIEGDEFVISLEHPCPKLLEALSFGLFAIVDAQKNFHERDGVWLANGFEKYNGAGPYKLITSSAEKFSFQLRKDFPKDLHHENAFEQIEFVFGKSGSSEIDLAESNSNADSFLDHAFFGGRGNAIVYFFCHPWKLASHPLSHPDIRKSIRSAIWIRLRRYGTNPTSSFFPLIMSGISEPGEIISSVEKVPNEFKGYKIRFYDSRPGRSRIVDSYLDALEGAIKDVGLEPVAIKGMTHEEESKNADPNLKNFTIDIGFYATGIAVADPEGDIKFMFSRQGIWLPDADGSIHKELNEARVSPQKVNQLLFDQSIIWPVTHATYGIWAKKHLDLNRYNKLLPLGEIQWVGERR